MGIGLGNFCLHLPAELLVLPDQFDEFPHQLITLIFQELVAAGRGREFPLQVAELHSRRVDV